MHFSKHSIGSFLLINGSLLLLLSTGAEAADSSEKAQKPDKADKNNTDPLFPFTISEETTRVTEPLTPNGSPDYAAALNARFGKGVTPENNAAAFLIQALGVKGVPKKSRGSFFKSLGIPMPKDTAGRLQNLNQFAQQQKDGTEAEATNEDRQKLFDHQSAAMSRPWSRKEFPAVAGWVDANAGPLDVAVEASKKSRFFLPMTTNEDQPLLAANLLGPTQKMRSVARLLSARAMLAIGEGRIEEAQTDLLACHRLASLLGQQPTMIEALVSYAIDAVACEGDRVLAQSEKIDGKQLAAYRKKLTELPPLATMSETIDQGERLVSLDAICNLAMQQDDEAAQAIGIPNGKLFKRMLGLTIDWDLILKRFNKEYDQMVAALNQPSHAARQAAIAKINADLKALQAEAKKPSQIALMLLGVDPPRAVASRQMGNVLISLLIPAVRQASEAETRAHTRRDLTVVALALAEFQRENGKYPEKLSELSPTYLKFVPQDGFTGKSFKYQRQGKGYLLYSVGTNGKDDKGQRRGNNADDLSIRVPEQPEL